MDHEIVYLDSPFESFSVEHSVYDNLEFKLKNHSGRISELPNINEIDALVVTYREITRDVIDCLNNCKVIARTGIGVDNINVEAATDNGIYVTNVPDYCISEVSDHTIAMILSLVRNIVQYNSWVKDGKWERRREPRLGRLQGKSLGLVGFGNIAQQVCRKAQAFGLEVTAYDPYLSEGIMDEVHANRIDELNDLLRQSDIVSLHPPLTEETVGMIGAEEIQIMKDTAILINASRGKLIQDGAITWAIQSGEIAGVGLDVFRREPPDLEEEVIESDKVILTPHIAWMSEESKIELRRKSAENVRSVLQGSIPDYPVNSPTSE